MDKEVYLQPTILSSTDPQVLSGMVGAERRKRGQTHAKAYYSATYVPRSRVDGSPGNGYTKYFAFIEFAEEAK